MLRWIIAALLPLYFASVAAAQVPAKDNLTESVDRALAMLALLQEKDGAWQLSGNPHPAVTSLAIMAYLSAGHVPGEGPYQANLEKGIRYVLASEQPNGLFGIPTWEEMYQHGICTLMLCEVSAMIDAKTARLLKPKLEKAVKLILQAQRTENNKFTRGGWRYRLDGNDADLSVTGWQIMALRAARNLGCDVPVQRIDLAMQFVEQCRHPSSGGYQYIPGGGFPNNACTGTGILALELCGKDRHHSREALQAGSFLLKNPLRLDENHSFYAAYYASQAMFQLGNNYWATFRPHLHKLLLGSQQTNGSWISTDFGPKNGTSYSTAMAVLALTVEYRLLPIYQRDEGPELGKEKK